MNHENHIDHNLRSFYHRADHITPLCNHAHHGAVPDTDPRDPGVGVFEDIEAVMVA
jgi:hypothetical protein